MTVPAGSMRSSLYPVATRLAVVIATALVVACAGDEPATAPNPTPLPEPTPSGNRHRLTVVTSPGVAVLGRPDSGRLIARARRSPTNSRPRRATGTYWCVWIRCSPPRPVR